MKYDLTKKRTRGAERTLRAFAEALFALLREESFEKISVQELCDKSLFPRATFYNYFEDKYDLLEYCWWKMTRSLNLETLPVQPSSSGLLAAFDALYDLFNEQQDWLQAIAAHNEMSGQLVNNFVNYLQTFLGATLEKMVRAEGLKLPLPLLARHYSHTLILLMQWIFLEGHQLSRAEAAEYMKAMLPDPKC